MVRAAGEWGKAVVGWRNDLACSLDRHQVALEACGTDVPVHGTENGLKPGLIATYRSRFRMIDM